jgi:hypothetical protein
MRRTFTSAPPLSRSSTMSSFCDCTALYSEESPPESSAFISAPRLSSNCACRDVLCTLAQTLKPNSSPLTPTVGLCHCHHRPRPKHGGSPSTPMPSSRKDRPRPRHLHSRSPALTRTSPKRDAQVLDSDPDTLTRGFSTSTTHPRSDESLQTRREDS